MFPVDRESFSLMQSAKYYPHIHIHKLVSIASWGYIGDKYQCSDEYIEVSCDLEGCLKECSVIWIVDSWNHADFNNVIKPAIQLAVKQGKRVICSKILDESERELISGYSVFYIQHTQFSHDVSIDDRVQEVRTPVVYVMSSTEYCNQLFIETALTFNLRNRGYNVLFISSLKESVAFNEYTIPDFMYSERCSENRKILSLNRYVCHLEMKHHPDLIVMGIPGVAMSYDYRFASDFGIIAYEISEAVKPDFAILSSPSLSYEMHDFNRIEEALFGRLGVSVNIHTLSYNALDFFTNEMSLSYLTVDEAYTNEIIARIGYKKLLNLNEEAGITLASDRVINFFSDSSSSVLM